MLPIFKGVPQGSILGPNLFRIFINELFFSVKNCSMYNYADDNTLSKSDKTLEKVISALEEDSNSLINCFFANKMQANHEKFQAISVGRKMHDKNVMFNLNGINLSCEDEVKLLGVTIDFKLNFNTHISSICKKTARQLNALKRIGKHLNRLGKLTIYYSFIMSNFSYCPLTWHFCGEQNTKKIEKIQECALRFIYDDFQNSYEFLLEKSKLPSLKTHRMRTIALETFKIINKKSPLFIQDLVIIKNNSYNFRYTNTAEVPRPITSNYGKRSFRYEAAQLWNSLPNEARIMTSFDQFKKYINRCGQKCTCSACRILPHT